MMTILWWIICGYISGSLALWMFPPKQPIPGWQTVAYGVAGSVVGGMISAQMSGDCYSPGGILMSAAGAIVVILGVQWYTEQN